LRALIGTWPETLVSLARAKAFCSSLPGELCHGAVLLHHAATEIGKNNVATADPVLPRHWRISVHGKRHLRTVREVSPALHRSLRRDQCLRSSDGTAGRLAVYPMAVHRH